MNGTSSEPPSARSALTTRQIPRMTLSTGTESSMTGPPLPAPHYLDAEGKAQWRFAVEGNAVVTGGTGALGLESARALLEHGCSGLALLDLEPSQSAASSLRDEFPKATIMVERVNVSDAAAVKEAMSKVASELVGIDMLLCFAGVVSTVHAMETTPEQWRQTLDINATGSFICAQAAAKHMIDQGTGGSIVLTASISGKRVNFPQPQVAYNASKAAVLALRASLAAEWAQHGIRVNSVSPGYMDTVLNEGDGLEPFRKTWMERNPMGRMGQPAELTGVIVLLCSRAGGFINGADIVVDGGGSVF